MFPCARLDVNLYKPATVLESRRRVLGYAEIVYTGYSIYWKNAEMLDMLVPEGAETVLEARVDFVG